MYRLRFLGVGFRVFPRGICGVGFRVSWSSVLGCRLRFLEFRA